MFADRPHIATLAYKVGKAAFNKEHALQIYRVRRGYRGRTLFRQRLTIAIAQPVLGRRLKKACEPAFKLVIADLIRMHSFYYSARERIHGMRRNA